MWEFKSKEEAWDEIARKFEERDDFNENGVDSLESFIYGSTEDDSDPNGLDSNRLPSSYKYEREDLKKLLWRRFVTGQAKFEDI